MKIVIGIVMVSALAFAADKPELFGTWQQSMSSTTGATNTMQSEQTVTISKKGKIVHISLKNKTGNDEKVVESDCRSDGKYHPVIGAEGGSILCKFQGDTLVTDRQWGEGQNHEHILMTLSPDGETLTEQIHTEKSSVTDDSTLVLKRQ